MSVVFKQLYERIMAKRSPKVELIAVVRKRLLIAHALVKNKLLEKAPKIAKTPPFPVQ